MPIYEYVCMSCEAHFEELVRGDETPACPSCGGANVSKQFSRFAIKAGAAGTVPSFTPPAGGGRGGCCGGGCGCGH